MDTDKDPATGMRSSAFALVIVGLAFSAVVAVVLIALLMGRSGSSTQRANVVSPGPNP